MTPVGITLSRLATGLAEAVAKDEHPEAGGFDLSAGMFGTAVSAWLRDVAQVADEIERLRAEVARLTPPPRGQVHSCDIPGCAVCDYTAGL